MEVGYFTMPLHPPGSDLTRTLQDDLQQVVTLDRLGYKEAWIGEHFTAQWENIPAPDLFIAQALSLTSDIVLGTGVTCMPNHNPFMVAHRIAQLDHMAEGRFHWGVGSGGFPGDFTVFGYDPESGEHRTMTRDALELVLEIWENPKPGRYKTRWWEFTIPEPDEDIGLRYHIKPYQQPHPPIGVAGVSSKSETLRLAGERGYLPLSINIVPPSMLESHWDAVEAGAQSVGKTVDRSTWRIAREVYVGETTAQAREDALNGNLGRDFREYFLKLLKRDGRLDLMKNDPNMPDSEVTLDYLLDNVWIVGDPEEVERKIRELHSTVGGFGVLLTMGHEWEPRESWERSVTLLRQEVIPKLSDLS